MNRHLLRSLAPMGLAALIAGPAVHALPLQNQAGPDKFVPFNDFVQNVMSAPSAALLARPGVKVKEAISIEEMRQHILSLYTGVDVKHSYVLGAQTYDCVPIDQQPSVRLRGLKNIAAAPPDSAAHSAAAGQGASETAAARVSQLPKGVTADKFGNALGCEAHTIPMRRVTLEEMSHFKNLKEFFEKGPNGAGQAPHAAKEVAPSVYGHKYSYTYQYVDNLGAATNINLWQPYVDTSQDEIFSLAQSWTIGDSWGTTQTAEVGTQNFPAKYGSENPSLFIYWTADGYNNTGCYNLDCAAFVQTSSDLHLGSGFTNYSTYGGAQYEIELQYYLYQGNWWLRANNEWVGYYPSSIYNGGQLTYSSDLIEYGSESVGSSVWPPEGSGLWPAYGWTYAGYQRLVYYVDTSNVSQWASLTDATPSPACYSINGPYWGGSSWGIYFYFGGPGGTGC